MSFRGRGDSGGNPNKIELGETRRFGGADEDKPTDGSEERVSRFGGSEERVSRFSSSDERVSRFSAPEDRVSRFNAPEDRVSRFSAPEDRVSRFDSVRGRRPPFGRGRASPSRDKFGDRPREFPFGRDDHMRDRSPIHRSEDRFSDRFKKDNRDDPLKKDSGRPFYGDDGPRDRFMDRSRPEEVRGNFNSRFDGPPGPQQFRPPRPGPVNYPNAPQRGSMYSEGFPKPNECEIIAVSKHQRAYAESVEERVKGLGILVDILFLKDEALLAQTIDDIARKGSLYAMVINAQNETHGSITVNILHGTPQEHRNMPLEDALKLLSRNFHEHIRSQKERMDRERSERGPYVGVVSADHEVQFLLKMLADGRWISHQEIDLVIRYLCERRDKMQGTGDDRGHGRMPVPAADIKMDTSFKPKDDVTQKEQDLQNKIMNIMNQGAPPVAAAGGGIGSSVNQGGIPGIDLTSSAQNAPSISAPLTQTGMKPGRSGLPENVRDPPGLDSSSQLKESANQVPFSSSGSTPSLTSSTSHPATYINFDNQIVQKALDSLIQSGPNILKSISLSTSSITNTPSNQPPPTQTTADNTRMNMPGDTFNSRGNLNMPRAPDVSNPPPRLPGSMDIGARGNTNLPDIGPGGMSRNMNMSDAGGIGGPRNMNIPGIGGMLPNRGGYGSGGLDNMSNPRGFGGVGVDMGKLGPRGGLGQDLGPMQNMGGGNFPNQNQFNKFQGPGHPGSYPNSYSTRPSLGGNYRQNFGGPQGMGGGPRRY